MRGPKKIGERKGRREKEIEIEKREDWIEKREKSKEKKEGDKKRGETRKEERGLNGHRGPGLDQSLGGVWRGFF